MPSPKRGSVVNTGSLSVTFWQFPLNIEIGKGLTVVRVIAKSTAESMGVCKGMMIVGVNNVPVTESMEDPDDHNEFTKMMRDISLPMILHFNQMPEKPPATKQDKFKALLSKGIQVEEVSRGMCAIRTTTAILYCDSNSQVLICGPRKGSRTQKVFSMYNIRSITPKGKTQLHICTAGDSKKGSVSLKLKLPTPNGRDLLHQKLHKLVKDVQDVHNVKTLQ